MKNRKQVFCPGQNTTAVIAALCLLLSTSCQAESLNEALTRLLNEHPKLIAAKQTANAVNAEIESARDGYFPTLRVSGNTGEDRYQDTFRTGEDYVDLTKEKATVEVTQNLFKGFRNRSEVAESLSRHQIASHSIRHTEQKLLAQGAIAYLDVVSFERSLSLVDEKVKVARRYLELKERAQSSGGGDRVEVFEAQLNLQRALQKQLEIEAQKRLAERTFEELFGYFPEPETMITPVFPADLLPVSLVDALAMARERNAKIAIAEERITQARHQKAAVSGEYWPVIDLKGLYDYEKNKQGIEGITRETYVSLNLSWDFNLGNQTGSKVRAASERVLSEQYAYDATLREEEKRVRQSWERHDIMMRRNQLAEETLAIANEVLTARKEQKQRGKGDEVHVLDAYDKVLSSRLVKLAAEREVGRTAYELALAVASLRPAELSL